MPVPVVVAKSYELPAFVGEGSLVFAVSFSGDTEETVEAASEAAVQGAKIVAVSGGGELTRLAKAWSAPIVSVPDDLPQPRAGVGDLTRQAITLVALRHDFEHPQVMRRFELVFRMVDEVVAGIVEVQARGEGQLAQLLDLMMVGDFVSLQLAINEGIDPGPVPALDEIKIALKE